MEEYEDDYCAGVAVKERHAHTNGHAYTNGHAHTNGHALEEYDDDHDEIAEVAPYTLPPASPEQQKIIAALRTHNAIVDAVAGSGKTTTVLHIAQALGDDKILLLTYNAGLKHDTAARAYRLGVNNLEVRTYHSYCVRHVNAECFNDTGIMKHLPAHLRHVQTTGAKCKYDLVIVDECQDMTSLYFDVARAAIAAGTPRLLVVGDRCQSIYQYKGSDPRYLTLADVMYRSPHKWSRLCLSVSYRITRQMAALVNCVKSSETPRITAVKDGPLPNYMHCTPTELANVIASVVKKNNPEDVFVLAPSVRIQPRHRLAPVANALSRLKVPIYIPNSDEKCPDDSVLRGKAAFITFHQAKGLERKIVFVLSFDQTLFSRQEDVPGGAPNELYVALTRASEQLYLWHTNQPINPKTKVPPVMLPYLQPADIERLCKITHQRPSVPGAMKRIRRSIPSRVTDIVRHIPEFYSDWMLSLVHLQTLRKPAERIQIPPVVIQREKYYEEVSDITGTASVAYYEQKTTGKCSIRDEIPIPRKDLPALPRLPEDILRCANLYNAEVSKLKFKTVQITQYNWASQEQFDAMSERLSNVIPGENEFERPLAMPGFDQQYRYTCIPRGAQTPDDFATLTTGRADVVSNGDQLFEIKTVHELTSEHYLQLLMYYYGMRCEGVIVQPYLYNILTDNLVSVTVSDANLLTIMRALNHVNNHADDPLSDQEFIARERFDKTPADLINACPKCAGTFVALPDA